MESEYDELIQQCSCFQVFPDIWFGYITPTKYVWSMGSSQTQCLKELGDSLKEWLDLGKPTNLDINSALELIKAAYEEYQANPELAEEELNSKSTTINSYHSEQVSVFDGFDDTLWMLSCNMHGKVTFKFKGTKLNGNYLLECDELGAKVGTSVSKDELIEFCMSAVCSLTGMRERDINVFIELDNT